MNNLKLEKLLKELIEQGKKEKEYFYKTIALALWNQLEKEELQKVINEIENIKKSNTLFL